MFASIKRLLPQKLKKLVKNSLGPTFFGCRAYSQEGEDLILARLFEDQIQGFYVDIGAHHPYRFSNTYLFYKRGWRGINIDPRPGSKAMFDRWRGRDINIQIGVAERKGELMLHVFNDEALNTFDARVAEERDGHKGYYVIKRCKVPVMTLAEILESYLPKNVREIDFLSVDAEGYDHQVILSNDWNRFRPKIVIFEQPMQSIEEVQDSNISKFLAGEGYRMCAKTVNSIFFVRNGAVFYGRSTRGL